MNSWTIWQHCIIQYTQVKLCVWITFNKVHVHIIYMFIGWMCNTLQSPVMASNKRTKHLSFKITFPYYLGIPLQCQMIDNELKNITYLKYIPAIYLMMTKVSQVDRVARYLSGQRARTVCGGSWVRVPVGPCAFFLPCDKRSYGFIKNMTALYTQVKLREWITVSYVSMHIIYNN